MAPRNGHGSAVLSGYCDLLLWRRRRLTGNGNLLHHASPWGDSLPLENELNLAAW